MSSPNGRDILTPLTREIRQWYGDPSTGTVSKGFEKVVGQKLSAVVPSRDILLKAPSCRSSPATKLFRLTPMQKSMSSGQPQTRARSHPSGRPGAESKANTVKSESSSSVMRELDSLRASSTTPTREQIAIMLADLLLEMSKEDVAKESSESLKKAPTSGNQEQDPRWEPEVGVSRVRPNALSPSKQKRLHQIVRRFGKDSSKVFEACQAVAAASSDADKAKAMQALRDEVVKDTSRQATMRAQQKQAQPSVRQEPQQAQPQGSTGPTPRRPRSGPPEKLHKHLKVHRTGHLKSVITSPDLMRRKLDEFGLMARQQNKERLHDEQRQKEHVQHKGEQLRLNLDAQVEENRRREQEEKAGKQREAMEARKQRKRWKEEDLQDKARQAREKQRLREDINGQLAEERATQLRQRAQEDAEALAQRRKFRLEGQEMEERARRDKAINAENRQRVLAANQQALKEKEAADRAEVMEDIRLAHEARALMDEREKARQAATAARLSAIEANEARGQTLFASAQADAAALEKAAEARDALTRQQEAERERRRRQEQHERTREQMAGLSAQLVAEQAQRAQEAQEERTLARKTRQLWLEAKAKEEQNLAERRAKAKDNQRVLIEQIQDERRCIRLGAGQYGMSAHELRFNARKVAGFA